MIQFNNVYLSYGTELVLNGLTFCVDKGRHVCISGPSGKGKSSILNMVQGYVLPDEGEVVVEGMPLSALNIKSVRSRLAFVPQNVNLPVKNGKELFSLIGKDVDIDEVIFILSCLGLSDEFFVRPFGKMSVGQKQRVVVSVCLALPGDILLLDEPTAALDDEAIDLFLNLLNKQEGRTILSASHNQKWLASVDNVISL